MVHVCAGAGGGDAAPATPLQAHTELAALRLEQGHRARVSAGLRGRGRPLGVSVSPPQGPRAAYLIAAGAL
jgi:hypothetical protein